MSITFLKLQGVSNQLGVNDQDQNLPALPVDFYFIEDNIKTIVVHPQFFFVADVRIPVTAENDAAIMNFLKDKGWLMVNVKKYINHPDHSEYVTVTEYFNPKYFSTIGISHDKLFTYVDGFVENEFNQSALIQPFIDNPPEVDKPSVDLGPINLRMEMLETYVDNLEKRIQYLAEQIHNPV